MIFFFFQMKLAEMELRTESARLLTWKAAMLKDAEEPFSKVREVFLDCYDLEIFKIPLRNKLLI